jgi:outer membrane receptor protein involved in Fe transport
MKIVDHKFKTSLAMLVFAAGSWNAAAYAQDEERGTPAPENQASDDEFIQEVVTTGRFISSSQQLVNERMTDAFAADLLGEDTISRLGDSTVGAALRRVPGLTLVQDKFVYIRGLGERYSQTTLNGAFIPSPDLTRNVIPLDVFPTSVVESLRVQKSYAPELSANFGGGAVDIRTKGIPDAFTLKFEFNMGVNTENPSKVKSYPGGKDDSMGTDDGTRELSQTILDAMATYRGELGEQSLLRAIRGQNPDADLFDAQTINRELAAALNRNIGIQESSVDPDYGFRASLGNKHVFGSDWEFGYNIGGSYEQKTRWRRTFTADVQDPAELFGNAEESTQSVNLAGTLNLGLELGDDHSIATTTQFLRNTDDETEVYDFHNTGTGFASGAGLRDYRLEFEERNMLTNQIKGTHYLGADTRNRIGGLARLIGWIPEDTKIEWFYSESEARTDIPNRVRVQMETDTDTTTNEVLAENLKFQDKEAASFRFIDLDDEVKNYGSSVLVPLDFGGNVLELSGGYDHSQKARTYEQTEFTLGYGTNTPNSTFVGTLDQIFSDDNLFARQPDNPLTAIDESRNYINEAEIGRTGGSARSYIAATMTDAVWGKVDWTWNETLRVAVGARWEDYRQAAVAWNPFGFSLGDPQIVIDPDDPSELAFQDDKVYPSAAITYMGDLWADTFQLRLGFSETVVRPDLREIASASYVDPITGFLTRGNPRVVPAEVENIDLRAEWYFASGDNLTITLFRKDITNPIEFVEGFGSDTTIQRDIRNLASAEVTGVEIEALKELASLGGFWETLFVQGNVTIQNSKLDPGADNAPDLFCSGFGAAESSDCRLSGASDHVINFMLGFDSLNTRHTASLIYNVFGERVFAFGSRGPDVFEQPFQSLDFTYFWYPTEQITIKIKAQNLLGETIQLHRTDEERVTVFEEDPGANFSVALSWQF